jgi:hypothetical protein
MRDWGRSLNYQILERDLEPDKKRMTDLPNQTVEPIAYGSAQLHV